MSGEPFAEARALRRRGDPSAGLPGRQAEHALVGVRRGTTDCGQSVQVVHRPGRDRHDGAVGFWIRLAAADGESPAAVAFVGQVGPRARAAASERRRPGSRRDRHDCHVAGGSRADVGPAIDVAPDGCNGLRRQPRAWRAVWPSSPAMRVNPCMAVFTMRSAHGLGASATAAVTDAPRAHHGHR